MDRVFQADVRRVRVRALTLCVRPTLAHASGPGWKRYVRTEPFVEYRHDSWHNRQRKSHVHDQQRRHIDHHHLKGKVMSSTTSTRRGTRSACVGFESLECRRLLSGKTPAQVMIQEIPNAPNPGLTELVITGTKKNDGIVIKDDGTNTPGNISVSLNNLYFPRLSVLSCRQGE